MKILVLSDIHANLSALRAILEHTQPQWERAICLGDMVGYGPEPDECVELVLKKCTLILAGNHDLAATMRIDIDDFSPHAYQAMVWTRAHLSSTSKQRLAGLEPLLNSPWALLSHGDPRDPIWSYIMDEQAARLTFNGLSSRVRSCFFGHTHLPSFFVEDTKRGTVKGQYGEGGTEVSLASTNHRYLLNPGSVGFPRDRMDAHHPARLPRAITRYALYDEETQCWTFYRLEYDMTETLEKMRRYKLW